MRPVIALLIGSILLVLPGLFLVSITGSSIVLLLGLFSLIIAAAGGFASTRAEKGNPFKFLSFFPSILLIILSKGYLANYLKGSAFLSGSEITLLLMFLFLAEIGLILIVSFESSNNLIFRLRTNGYEEESYLGEVSKFTDLTLAFISIAIALSIGTYYFITSIPSLQINPIFALIFFGILYLVVTRYFGTARKRELNDDK